MDCKYNKEVKAIKPINVDTVHKICSGQVVLNLAVTVKELVENSLDAGAKIIDVKLKNHGIELIEVSDNGTGITEDNFEALALKHHTSKLNEYADLLGVSSFGFRGEALSSLCALSKVTITTRHQSSEYATKIEYDYRGHIVKTTPCSRQVGTTVTLSNLFYSLPVRQKEFHKNVKREFTKMTQLLYAYCLISLGVKITCTNQTNTSSKSIVVGTQGSNDYKDNIASVFGSKQLQSLLEIKPEYVANIKENIFKGLNTEGKDLNSEENINITDVEIDLSEDSNDADNDGLQQSQTSTVSQVSNKSSGYKNGKSPIQFVGFISTCEHGSGRSSTDRQFYFVNSRPCEPVKITKLVNEIYRQFNPNQYPFVFFNVDMDRSLVDVNVTPDKRKIFLTREKLILDTIKWSLLKLFEHIPRTLKVEPSSTVTSVTTIKTNKTEPCLDQPRIFNSFLQTFANKSNKVNMDNSNKISELKRKSSTILDFVTTKLIKIEEPMVECDDEPLIIENSNSTNIDRDVPEILVKHNENICNNEHNNQFVIKETEPFHHANTSADRHENKEIVFLEYTDKLPDTQIRNIEDVIEQSHTVKCKTKSENSKPSSPLNIRKISPKINKVVTDKEDIGKSNKKSVIMKTSLEHVKALTKLFNKQKKRVAPDKVKFRTGINPVFNKTCEEELTREISKSSFKNMSVVGQFNLGFIIAQLDDDLFIIDQHATDEIYNFEILQKTTDITSQKLVIPQQLELTGVNEQILVDNLDIFKKNGFNFDIDEDELPTKRVKLLTIPMSKNWIFGKDDIEELLFMLRESPTEVCRPSRVRAMFASRACRKSVMIGTALSKSDMKTLVDHMAEIEQPWNCPHGRPTVRHLINLAVVHTTR